MTAVRETILAAIDSALSNGTSAEEIERMPSGDPTSWPALHIYDDGQGLDEAEAGASRYGMALTIEGYVEGAGGTAASQALNQLYADTVTAVMGLEGVQPEIETVREGDMRVTRAALASGRRLAFALDFTITFATRRGLPEQT
jgi:hypothetical protein